eukprot:RCo045740
MAAGFAELVESLSEDEIGEIRKWHAHYLGLKRRATESQLSLLKAFKQCCTACGGEDSLSALERRLKNALRKAELDFRSSAKGGRGSPSPLGASEIGGCGADALLSLRPSEATGSAAASNEPACLYSKMFRLENDNEVLRARAADAQLRAERSAQELAELRQKLSEMSTQLYDLQERTVVAESLSDMQAQLRAAELAAERKTERCQAQAIEISELHSKIFRLSGQLADREEENAQLRAHIQELEEAATESCGRTLLPEGLSAAPISSEASSSSSSATAACSSSSSSPFAFSAAPRHPSPVGSTSSDPFSLAFSQAGSLRSTAAAGLPGQASGVSRPSTALTLRGTAGPGGGFTRTRSHSSSS